MDFLSYFYLDSDREHQEYKYREVLVNAMLVFSMLTLSVFSMLHFYKDDLILPIIQLLLVVVYAFSFFDPFQALSKRFKENLVISGMIFLCLFLLVDGGIAKTGIYWVPFFPFIAFALSGIRRGWRWVAVFALGLVGIQVFDYLDVLDTAYSFEEMCFFTFSLVIYIVLAVLFEGLSIRQQNELETQHESLAAMREKLGETLSGLEQKVEARTFELKMSNQQLAQEIESHKLTNRNLKQTEQKFYQAKKMEALGTLVGGIAHDFNSIILGINANLFLVQRQIKDKPQVQGLLDEIETMSFHAADMTNQLLTFARKDNVKKMTFDMSLFMVEGIKLATATLPSRIKLETHLSNKKLPVLGNATQLQQVVMNLMANARDALSKVDSPIISICLSSLADDEIAREKQPNLEADKWIYLAVSDNGIGMSAADLPHIFEPFFSTKAIGKGIGLGLAMCYGAIESHGGVIEVESQLNQGSTFHIYLPAAQLSS